MLAVKSSLLGITSSHILPFSFVTLQHQSNPFIVMQYLSQLLSLVAEMIPYLLLGFLFAGLLHVLVPHKFYQKYLSQNNFRSVILASLFGIPLPLCSCGVIPTAMSLRKEGGSKAATTAFLCATPQTGIDSILATFSVFGLAFALIRPIAALFSAVVIGILICIIERKKDNQDNTISSMKSGKSEEKQEKFYKKMIRALRYGFVEMIQDIGGHMITGLVIAALISVALPESWLVSLADRPLLEMLAVLLFAIPMYVCATGSIPIAAALMLKGLTPGAALVFLMAGPAINFASLLVVNKALGKKATGIFLIGIIVCALIFGLSIDYLMPSEWFSAISSENCHHEAIGLWQWICLAAFILLLINAFALRKHHHGEQSCHCGCHEEDCGCNDEGRECHEESCGCNDDDCDCHEEGCGCHEEDCECKGDCNGHHNKKDDEEDAANHEESAFFEIEGMRCNHCRSNLEEALSKIDGVKSVSVSLEEKRAIVLGHFNKQDVINCIREMGFNLKDSLSE